MFTWEVDIPRYVTALLCAKLSSKISFAFTLVSRQLERLQLSNRSMHVTKRNGSREVFSEAKLSAHLTKLSAGLEKDVSSCFIRIF